MNEQTQLSPALAAFYDDVRHWAAIARKAQSDREAQAKSIDEDDPATTKKRGGK